MTGGFAWWRAAALVARCWWGLGLGYCLLWAASALRVTGTAALRRGWGGVTDALFPVAGRLYDACRRECRRFDRLARELYRIEWERRR